MTFRQLAKHKIAGIRKKYNLYRERKKYGFTNEDIYSLDTTIAKFVLPRLIEFKRVQKGQGVGDLGSDTWDKKIDDMIFAMEYVASDNIHIEKKKDAQKIRRGLKAFGDYFTDLWY